jgi:predicted membrane protein
MQTVIITLLFIAVYDGSGSGDQAIPDTNSFQLWGIFLLVLSILIITFAFVMIILIIIKHLIKKKKERRTVTNDAEYCNINDPVWGSKYNKVLYQQALPHMSLIL